MDIINFRFIRLFFRLFRASNRLSLDVALIAGIVQDTCVERLCLEHIHGKRDPFPRHYSETNHDTRSKVKSAEHSF